MLILVEEEYGYRYWRWDYPGTEAELRADWKAKRAPLNFFNPSDRTNHPYKGTVEQIEYEDYTRYGGHDYKYRMHTHTDDDSYLCIRSAAGTPEYVQSDWADQAMREAEEANERERALDRETDRERD